MFFSVAYKQAGWHLAVVQEGLGPPSPTHYLTPLTARTEATIQGDVLQNTFRLFLCLLKRGFSPIIRNWAFWLALINTFCTKHWTFQCQVILNLLHCLSGKKTGFVVSLGILVETKTKGGLTWTQLQFLRKLGHAMNVNKCLIFSAITLHLRSHSLRRVFSRDMFLCPQDHQRFWYEPMSQVMFKTHKWKFRWRWCQWRWRWRWWWWKCWWWRWRSPPSLASHVAHTHALPCLAPLALSPMLHTYDKYWLSEYCTITYVT